MARFQGTVQGSMGEASRLGGKDSGVTTNNNGWSSGVRVNSVCIDGVDEFRIYGTSGSGCGKGVGYIGTVIGDKFIAAGEEK